MLFKDLTCPFAKNVTTVPLRAIVAIAAIQVFVVASLSYLKAQGLLSIHLALAALLVAIFTTIFPQQLAPALIYLSSVVAVLFKRNQDSPMGAINLQLPSPLAGGLKPSTHAFYPMLWRLPENRTTRDRPLGSTESPRRSLTQPAEDISSLLAEAEKITHIGSWEWDLATDTITWSEEFYRLVGLDPRQKAPSYAEFLLYVYPDDVGIVRRAVEQCLSQGKSSQIDYRIVPLDGAIRQVSAKWQLLRDEAGRSQRLFSITIDITNCKQAEFALQESKRSISMLLSNLPGMAYRCRNDRNWTMEFVSEGSYQLTGYYPSAWINNRNVSIEQITHPDDRASVRIAIDTALKENRPYQIVYRLITASGEQKWAWEEGRGIRDTTGKITILEGLIVDITERKRTEEALRAAEAKYRNIFENAVEGIFQTTPDGRYLSANPALARIYGYASEAELLAELTDIERQLYVDPKSRSHFIRLLHTHDVVVGFESQIYRKDGSIIWISENARAVRDREGSLLYYEGMVEDITERRQFKSLLAGQNQVLELIAKGTDLSEVLEVLTKFVEELCPQLKCSILLLDRDGLTLRCGAAPSLPETYNRAVDGIEIGPEAGSCGTAAYRRESVIVSDIAADPRWEKWRDLALACGLQACASTPIFSTTGQVLGTFAVYYKQPQQLTGSEQSAIAKATQLAGIAIERDLVEQQLYREAFYDSLTDLPNRTWLMKQLECSIERMQSGQVSTEKVRSARLLSTSCLLRHQVANFAVLFLDLDGFKVINDSLGHLVGDRLLQNIARRLEACLDSNATIARLGGDEFTILLEGIEEIGQATRLAERIHASLAAPFDLDGHEVFTNASIGIVFAGQQAERQKAIATYNRPEDLLRDADIAMYQAKASGRGRYAVFDVAMHDRAVTRLQLETELRRAIERQEFQLHYQPIINLATGQIAGFEALLRWYHPVLGIVSPVEFIPIAEETGLIVPLGEWVLEEACRQIAIWQREYAKATMTIGVNISAIQLAQPNFIEQLDRILQQTGLAGESLKLEITETAIVESAKSTLPILAALKHRQIDLCIDDFGTGYSSLSRLHQLPIDTLKIDKSFVSQMQADGGRWKMMGTIVTLARNLEMEAIAEGVETQEQLNQLRSLKCQLGQGYFFSPPLDARSAQALMNAAPQW